MSKLAIILGVVAAALLALVVVVFAFGTPTQGAPDVENPIASAGSAQVADPAAPAEAAAEAPADASAGAPASAVVDAASGGSMGDVPVTGTEAPPPDPSSPLAIQIPGCVCHSKDPKVVKAHEGYRMNQCAGCHAGGVPTGQ